MLADALRLAYRYNTWAMDRLLATAAETSADQLHAAGLAGQRSIRDAFVHAFEAHRGWLSWWDGSLSAAEAYAFTYDPDTLHDIPAIKAAWAEIAGQTEAFVASLTDDDAARVLRASMPNGQEFAMTLWPMMLHVANHGTQHRSEIALMLTQLGHSPGDLDMIFYHAATQAEAAPAASAAGGA